MSKFGKRLLKAAEEAVAVAKGEIPAARITIIKHPEWRTIESAPKDGRDVLLYNEVWEDTVGGVQIASWDDGEWTYQSGLDTTDEEGVDYGPTHWMPLPDPPKGDAA